MLPDSYDPPTHVPQLRKIPLIPLSRIPDFFLPKLWILMFPLWKPISMPKITIQEHNNPCIWKNNVRLAGKIAHMFPKTQATLMQFRSHNSLGPCVFALYLRHTITMLLRSKIPRHNSLFAQLYIVSLYQELLKFYYFILFSGLSSHFRLL